MPDHDQSMLNYLQLALLSQRKRQLPGRDRLLVLAAVAATRAGYPEIAVDCRRRVLQNNPRHLLSHYLSVPEAICAEDGITFFRQLERLCNHERAEHLLDEARRELTPPAVQEGASAGELAGEWLKEFDVPERLGDAATLAE